MYNLTISQSYHGGSHVIHHREDSRGSLALYELTDGEVVEILDIFPLYSLLFVLLLLGFQGKLDEDLLQLLVDKIYAKLFESILLKDFESINIEDAYI